MSGPAIIPVTATLEALLAECVGDAPELVKLADWRTIALRLSRRMEESGLVIQRRRIEAGERAQIAGPIRRNEMVVAVADGPDQAVVLSTGVAMRDLPQHLAKTLWRDMLDQAVADLAQAQEGKRR